MTSYGGQLRRRRAALALAMMAVPAVAKAQRPNRADWIVHRDDPGGYYLTAPPTWRRVETRNPGERMLLFAPPPQQAGKPGDAQFSVIVQPEPSTARMSQAQIEAAIVRPMTTQEWRQIIGHGRIHSIDQNRLARVNDRVAQAVVFTYRYESFTNAFEMTTQMVIVQRPGRNYIFGLTVGTNTRREADQGWRAWRPELEGILGTLSFTF